MTYINSCFSHFFITLWSHLKSVPFLLSYALPFSLFHNGIPGTFKSNLYLLACISNINKSPSQLNRTCIDEYKLTRKHTGSVVCPASSMIHMSNLLFASKGLVIPKHVTATTLTWSNLSLMSSTLHMSIPVKETLILKENLYPQKEKERSYFMNSHLKSNAFEFLHAPLHVFQYAENLCSAVVNVSMM